jgi:hypothetical protein
VTTRINKNNIQEGYATSVSVKLSDPKFWDHIEDGIKPLVLALRSKGYFTLSSCEGHSLHDYAEVVVAVPSGMTAIEATLRLKGLLSFCSVTSCSPQHYMEKTEDMKEEYKGIPDHRAQGDYNTRRKMDTYEATYTLNQLFDRSYNEYTLIFIRVIPTLKELALPLAWLARNMLGSYLVNRAARIINKKLEVFHG